MTVASWTVIDIRGQVIVSSTGSRVPQVPRVPYSKSISIGGEGGTLEASFGGLCHGGLVTLITPVHSGLVPSLHRNSERSTSENSLFIVSTTCNVPRSTDPVYKYKCTWAVKGKERTSGTNISNELFKDYISLITAFLT